MSRVGSTSCSILSVGVHTPLGLYPESAAAAVRAGISRVVEHPYMVDRAGEPLRAGMVPGIEGVTSVQRMEALARPAIAQALEHHDLDAKNPLPTFMVLPEPDASLTRDDLHGVCSRLRFVREEPLLRPIPILRGPAGTAVALEQAAQGLRDGLFNRALVVATDSFLDADRVDALQASKRLAVHGTRWGFRPGEAAGAWLLARGRHGGRPLAWVGGVGSSLEPHTVYGDGESLGVGLSAAMTAAARQAGARIGRQYCDIDGERHREVEFGHALMRTPSAVFIDAVDYVAPATAWGSIGAASLPVFGALAMVGHARGELDDAWVMLWAGSDHGLRGAVVLHFE